MRQEEAYRDIEVSITEDGVAIPIEDIESVEFRFGSVTKTYPGEDNVEVVNGLFYLPFTEEDTKSFGTHVVCQQKITFVDGEVRVSDKKIMLCNQSVWRV
jgi:hypothetical protein